MRRSQSGFTLIEIAIVLVIIGLLLGGVLKGQELINSAKVKNYAGDFRNIPVFIYGYQDKYKRLPGDDDAVDGTRFTGHKKATTNGTPGNGSIEGSWSSSTVTDETVLFWQHVRGAGLAAGSTDFTSTTSASLPTNADGGRIGVQSIAPILGMAGTYYACTQNIPYKLAEQLDNTLDDGKGDSGTVRAQSGTATNSANPGAAYVSTNATYTVCIAF
jgi:prepilin-type N-terminal cleavage/methylation domain-containing protein